MSHEMRPLAALGMVLLCASSAGAQAGDVLHVFRGGGSAGLGLGQVVSAAGDVNGDGFDDVIAGYRLGSGVRAGTARVFSGRDGTVLYTFLGKANQDFFGQTADGAGDVNGDGFDDLVVGAVGEDANGVDAGAAYVFSGRDGSQLYRFTGAFARARFGFDVSGAGDVNRDGRADIIVGGQPDPFTPQPIGHARVLSGADGSVLFDFIGPQSNSRLGCAVDTAGDVDGDGVGDLIVGDWRYRTTVNSAGAASVFSGADGHLILRVFGDRADDRVGDVVAGVGDMNGDGRADVLAGSAWADGASPDIGRIRIYSGADGSVLHEKRGAESLEFFGGAACGVGDFDADGVPDFAVGAYGDNDAATGAGSVRVFSGADGTQLLRRDGDSAGDELGFGLAAAGDVNGDGGMDFVIGAPNDDQGAGVRSGAVFVIAGTKPAPPVVNYCESGPNRYGAGATMSWSGSTSVAADDFVLRVDGARPRGVGVFLYGAQQQQVPFSQGFLCIARPRYRMGRVLHLDPHGSAELELAAVHFCDEAPAIEAGSTWNFQFLYLDPPSRKRGPFNLSDALSAEFVP